MASGNLRDHLQCTSTQVVPVLNNDPSPIFGISDRYVYFIVGSTGPRTIGTNPQRRLPLLGRLNLRISGNVTSRVAHVPAAGSLLSCSNISENGFDAVAEFRRVFIPDSPEFGDDGINLKWFYSWSPISKTWRPRRPRVAYATG